MTYLEGRGIGYLEPRLPAWYSGLEDATATLVTPLADQKVVVTSIYFSNNSAYDCISIGIRFGTGGTVRFATYLPGYGGTVFMNLVQGEASEGGGGQPLQIVVDDTNSPTILVTVGYFLKRA